MQPYNTYSYLYPPRPKNALPASELDSLDDGGLLAQLKFNGSNCVIFTNGIETYIMNRHGQVLTGVQIKEEILALFRGTPGKWWVLNGEYLNKNKKDEAGKDFNHRLIIFDILVHEGQYLVGQTFLSRVRLLDSIYGMEAGPKEYLLGVSTNIYRVKTYLHGFEELYQKYSTIDMIEGLVMKRKNAALEVATTENNNFRGQVKCRVATKNYKF